MVKKILIGSAIVVTTGVIVFGTDAWSYVTTSAQKVRSEVKANVPLEFEIERARSEVAKLVPDIRQNMHLIAQEEVEVEELQTQIAQAEKNLSGERHRIVTLRSDIDNSKKQFFYYPGRPASPQEVRTELARRFDRFQTAEATLSAKRQMLEARQKTLAAARDKLDEMLAAKRELEVEVQNLDARLKMVQAMEAGSRFHFDDSQLSRCKRVVEDIRKRLDVAERVLEQDGKLLENLTIEQEVPDDIGDEVDRYFGLKEGAGAASSTASL